MASSGVNEPKIEHLTTSTSYCPQGRWRRREVSGQYDIRETEFKIVLSPHAGHAAGVLRIGPSIRSFDARIIMQKTC